MLALSIGALDHRAEQECRQRPEWMRGRSPDGWIERQHIRIANAGGDDRGERTIIVLRERRYTSKYWLFQRCWVFAHFDVYCCNQHRNVSGTLRCAYAYVYTSHESHEAFWRERERDLVARARVSSAYLHASYQVVGVDLGR